MPKTSSEPILRNMGVDTTRLKGIALKDRLKVLKDESNQGHEGVREHSQGMLHAARAAGQALMEVKWRLGHRRKWSEWRDANFDGSKETSQHYMRVAREWDDPRVQEAMRNGLIDSINKFLKFLRGEPLEPKGLSEEELALRARRENLRNAIRKGLEELNAEELEVLEGFWKGRYWPKIRDKIRDDKASGRFDAVKQQAQNEAQEAINRQPTRRRCKRGKRSTQAATRGRRQARQSKSEEKAMDRLAAKL